MKCLICDFNSMDDDKVKTAKKSLAKAKTSLHQFSFN